MDDVSGHESEEGAEEEVFERQSDDGCGDVDGHVGYEGSEPEEEHVEEEVITVVSDLDDVWCGVPCD